MFKSGYITIIGRPNVGKSTLMNYLLGEKLSIVSSKPQTTRNNIQTILTTADYQMVFVDTPGIHKPRHKLGEYMVNLAEKSIREVDLILFLTTPDVEMGRGDKYILEQLQKAKAPVFLVVNKMDEVQGDRLAESLASFSKEYSFSEILPISALKGKNVDTLLNLMVQYLKEGPQYYPEDMVTDQQERFVVAEIIREKALRLLSEEVPHGTGVEIISMKQDEKGIYQIEATILCEKDSHKGIIIGKGGSMLKRIGSYAREDLEKFLKSKVMLKLWVKVKNEWRDDKRILRELGYK